jgi:transcriptional regulator with XRE-family HTH domain
MSINRPIDMPIRHVSNGNNGVMVAMEGWQMATFAKRLKQLRMHYRVTQEDLAAVIGVSRATVAGYEAPSKKREPDFEIVCRLAGFFGVSTDYLLGHTDDPMPVEPDTDVIIAARHLVAIRKSQGLSRAELAKRLKISVRNLTRYEMGLARLPVDLIDRLSEIFEVDREYFSRELSQEELEQILGETWFKIPITLSSEGKRSIEEFITFVMEREERKR